MAKTEEIDVLCDGEKADEIETFIGAVTRPSRGRACETGVISLHGAGGDLHSTHVDSTAEYVAETLETPVLRVTMKSPDLNDRLRAADGSMRLPLTDFAVRSFISAG